MASLALLVRGARSGNEYKHGVVQKSLGGGLIQVKMGGRVVTARGDGKAGSRVLVANGPLGPQALSSRAGSGGKKTRVPLDD